MYVARSSDAMQTYSTKGYYYAYVATFKKCTHLCTYTYIHGYTYIAR